MPNEQLLWLGRPSRWGLFRATPFLLILGVAWIYLRYLAGTSDATPWQYLSMMMSRQTGLSELIIAGCILIYALGLALRDFRDRWIYAITDHRLMTFYQREKLRETSIDRLDRLRVLRGGEAKLRDIGDLVWSRAGGPHSSRGRGPDQERCGFRGLKHPLQWKLRLQRWGEVLKQIAASDADTFTGSGPQAISETGDVSAAVPGMRMLVNRKYSHTYHWTVRHYVIFRLNAG